MSYLELEESAAPSTPAAGLGSTYLSTSGELRTLNDQGIDANLSNRTRDNWIRNAGFWFAQRQAPGTLTTYSSVGGRAITADGWGVSNENASVQYIRTDAIAAPETGLENRYYGNFTKITANGKIVICQVIEANDIAAIRGETVRVQILAKGLVAASATWRLGLVQLTSAGATNVVPINAGTFITAFGAASTDPTLGANLSYIAPDATITPDNGTTNGNAADITVTSAAWQQFGACFTVPTDCRNLVLMLWSDAQVATTNGIALTEVSLTAGPEVQEWSPLSQQEETSRVQRYYQKTFSTDTLPAQNAGLAGAARGHVSVAGATANQPIGVRLAIPLLSTSPTFTFFNPSAANAFVRNTTAGSDATATASANPAQQGFDVLFTGIAAWTVAQSVAVNWTCDGEL